MHPFFESVILDIIHDASLWFISFDYLGRHMFDFSTLAIHFNSDKCPSNILKGIMKFLNFHGLPEARLNRDDSVYGHWTNRRTWFIKSISILLFSAPDVHLRNLQNMWVDGVMHKAVWEESMKKAIDEWREFILYVSHKTLLPHALLISPSFYLLVHRFVKRQCGFSGH